MDVSLGNNHSNTFLTFHFSSANQLYIFDAAHFLPALPTPLDLGYCLI